MILDNIVLAFGNTVSDLEGLPVRTVRDAYSSSSSNGTTRTVNCYLKSDVEKRLVKRWCRVFICLFILVTLCSLYYRALEVWGSWKVLERELNTKRLQEEEEERRREGKLLVVISNSIDSKMMLTKLEKN